MDRKRIALHILERNIFQFRGRTHCAGITLQRIVAEMPAVMCRVNDAFSVTEHLIFRVQEMSGFAEAAHALQSITVFLFHACLTK